jgi:hypothetical protein
MTATDSSNSPLLEVKLYQSLVGALNYIATGTRPDIAFAVNFISRKLQAPTVADLTRAKKCLVYLRDTAERGLKMKSLKNSKVELKMFVDSSFGNGNNRRSKFGFVISVDGSVIHFKSKQHPLITLSSCEAEFVALSFGMKEVRWIENLLEELNTMVNKIVIFCDNTVEKFYRKNQAHRSQNAAR